MEKKDAAYFRKLAKNLMFNLSDEEAADIIQEFEILTHQLEILESIDTSGVEEMIYPFEDETFFIREDETSNVISQKEALENAPKAKHGHFVVPKVVK